MSKVNQLQVCSCTCQTCQTWDCQGRIGSAIGISITLQGLAASKVSELQVGAAEALLQLLQPVALRGHEGRESGTVQPQVRQAGVAAHVHAEDAGRADDQLAQVRATWAAMQNLRMPDLSHKHGSSKDKAACDQHLSMQKRAHFTPHHQCRANFGLGPPLLQLTRGSSLWQHVHLPETLSSFKGIDFGSWRVTDVSPTH